MIYSRVLLLRVVYIVLPDVSQNIFVFLSNQSLLHRAFAIINIRKWVKSSQVRRATVLQLEWLFCVWTYCYWILLTNQHSSATFLERPVPGCCKVPRWCSSFIKSKCREQKKREMRSLITYNIHLRRNWMYWCREKKINR